MLSSDLSVLDWQRCIGRVSVGDFVKVTISSPPLAKMLYRGNIALFKGVCSARPQLDVPSCLASSNCSGQSFFKPGASCWFIPSLRRSRRNAHSLRISTIRHRRLNPSVRCASRSLQTLRSSNPLLRLPARANARRLIPSMSRQSFYLPTSAWRSLRWSRCNVRWHWLWRAGSVVT
jgi:hypothetical protein